MIKISNRKVVKCQDWDDLVVETYGKTYCFQQQDGCKDRGNFNLTIPSKYTEDYKNEDIPYEINGDEMGVKFEVWKKTPADKWKEEATYPGGDSLWWERNFYPDVQMLANDLHEKGLIEAGDYTINIDW